MEQNELHYKDLLIQANSIESRNFSHTLQLLKECSQILKVNSDIVQDLDFHNINLQFRIDYLQNKPEVPINIVSRRQETPVLSEKLKRSPIIKSIYQKLLNQQSVSYSEYLKFYQTINKMHPNPNNPIQYSSSSTVYYIGDTHGAYEESISMIRYMESVIKKCPDSIFVFDGDYVDRNPEDLENVTLIFSFSEAYPHHVKILRGNHEDILINAHYGFRGHLEDAFPEDALANELYVEILEYFMKLSIGHVHEIPQNDSEKPHRIFCCHAGIPINNSDPYNPVIIQELESINTNVPSFKEFPPYMTWMLWADPKENLTGIELHPNTGRDNFGIDVFESFMAGNNLDLMIRAHVVLKEGYKYFFDKRMVSLFSASSYKNMPLGTAKFAKISDPNNIQFLPTESMMLDIDLAQMKCD